jgi:hypothetical protein
VKYMMAATLAIAKIHVPAMPSAGPLVHVLLAPDSIV